MHVFVRGHENAYASQWTEYQNRKVIKKVLCYEEYRLITYWYVIEFRLWFSLLKIEHTDAIQLFNGWRVHKYLSWLFLIVDLNECHNPLHIFRYFKPQQIVIGLHYDLEKMIYPLWKHGYTNQNGAELFNFSHLNLVQACRVWYCVLLSLPVIYLTAF